MNGVEAASSLFGPEEPASDPFAALGANTVSHPATGDLFHGSVTSKSSNFLEEVSNDAPKLNDAENPTPEVSQLYTQTEFATQGGDYFPGPYSSSLGASDTSEHGRYDERGQWHYYEQHVSMPALTTAERGNQFSQHYDTSSNHYDSYASAPNYTPAANASTYPQTYDAYAPPEPANDYPAPSSAAAPPSPYSAYPYTSPAVPQPAAPQYAPAYSARSQTTYTSQSINAAATVPPPAPVPVTTINRPKFSNAYDPPFPTTAKSTRRGAASRMGSGQQPYGGYNAYQPLSPTAAMGGPYATLPIPQAPPLPTHSPEQVPIHSNLNSGPADWGYSNHGDISSLGGGTPHAGVPNISQAPGSIQSLPDHGDPYNSEPWAPRPLGTQPEGSDPVAISKQPPNSYSSYGERHIDIAPRGESPNHTLPSPPLGPTYGRDTPSRLNPASLRQTRSPLPSPVAASPLSHPTSLQSDSPRQSAFPLASLPNDRPSQQSEPDYPDTKGIPSPILSVQQNGLPQGPQHLLPSSHLQQPKAYPSQLSTGERTLSPVPSHANKMHTSQTSSINAYPSNSSAGGDRVLPPAPPASGQLGLPYDSYAPKSFANGYNGERMSSPTSFSSPSSLALHNTKSPLTQHIPPRADLLRNRSMSNSSMLSSTSTNLDDPYAPSQQTQRHPSEAEYGAYSSRYNYPHEPMSHNLTPTLTSDHATVQEVLMKPFQTPYAPSPSLLGANDPLGRTAARVPIFSFGFGGKLVTCFHGAASMNTGFDIALSSRNTTGVHIRVLKKLIPESALDIPTALFPGPLFSDPGTPTTSLVRTGATAQTRSKKARVVKYLAERIDEIALGLRYLKPDSAEGGRAEGKIVLLKLLMVMVEHDGRLTGTPQLDSAVRVALLPKLEGSLAASENLTAGFSSISDTQSPLPNATSAHYPAVSGLSTGLNEKAISVTTVRPSTLDKIQNFLLRGERRQAYHYALDEKLWAHAMVIASSIDKEAWKDAVNEFLKDELGAKEETHTLTYAGSNKPLSALVNGRESLRAAYSLYSGQGAAAVQELMPQNLLARTTARSHMTPRTPNFATPTLTTNVPAETISRWAETAAMMLSSPLSPETSAALTALGDQLAQNQLFEAAHVCYLLTPQTSPMGGLGNPSARITLVGSRSPQSWPNFAKDPDPIVFSEIVEFALSLTPPSRGQDVYQGIAYLQAYRFIRAMSLAEIGDIQLANRYCEAITASVNRSSPYFTPILLDQLKGLSDRITGVAHVDKSGSWMGAKLSKPSLDTIGGWLEGRFTKLVTGDPDAASPPEEEVTKGEDRVFSGPFSHYSTISSATPSARSSPQPSVVNLNALPPPRSGSAMASSSYVHTQIDRSSSAMDHIRRKPSPGPRIASAGAATTTFSTSPSFGQVLAGQQTPNGYSPSDDLVTPRPSLSSNDDESMVQEATWWGSSSYGDGSTTQTPTASTFLRVDENAVPTTSDGFISLMDNTSYSVAPQSPAKSMPQVAPESEEAEEDLGFGNSKQDKQTSANGMVKRPPSPETAKTPVPEQPESKPAASGSWISRWWKRSESATPGPVKASLGEESAFYYDKDLKRWVNRKAGNDEAVKPAAPPPPPSRAQTASPGMTGPRPTGEGPPPARSASAIDLSTSPPSKTVMRVRSNLVPTPESAPSTPTGTRLAPPGPPPGRPKSQASKRNIRNRYVDVFQQEGAST